VLYELYAGLVRLTALGRGGFNLERLVTPLLHHWHRVGPLTTTAALLKPELASAVPLAGEKKVHRDLHDPGFGLH
jgi:hypothetical protein